MGIRRELLGRPEETRIGISSRSLHVIVAGVGARGKGDGIVDMFVCSLGFGADQPLGSLLTGESHR
jgi:hypothetical protein